MEITFKCPICGDEVITIHSNDNYVIKKDYVVIGVNGKVDHRSIVSITDPSKLICAKCWATRKVDPDTGEITFAPTIST